MLKIFKLKRKKTCGRINEVISQKLSMGLGDMYQAPWGSFAEVFIANPHVALAQKKVGTVTVPK